MFYIVVVCDFVVLFSSIFGVFFLEHQICEHKENEDKLRRLLDKVGTVMFLSGVLMLILIYVAVLNIAH